MIRVGHVLTHFALRWGGPERSVREIGKALQRLGVTASYWACGGADEREESQIAGSEVRVFESGWPRSWYRSPALARELADRISSFDLLHLHEVWTHPQFAASRIARRNSRPYVLSPRGSLQPWAFRGAKKKAYYALVARRMLGAAGCVHAVSDAEAENLRRMGFTGPLTIVPNGVDPEAFSSLPPRSHAESLWPLFRDRRVVLFLSRISREKGLDALVPAWLRIVRSHRDALLVIAGPAQDEVLARRLQSLIEESGVRDSVFFTGMVDGEAKRSLISRADLYTLPSYSEAFSVSLLENLAAGKPALITTSCNFPDVVNVGAGLSVPPRELDLEDGLRQLLALSDDRLREMGESGRRLVTQDYTWEMTARKLAAVYRHLIAGEAVPLHPVPVAIPSAGKLGGSID